ncbi:MAG: uncharacterized protein KVP18_004634 [Porospora cf. gigantea A]|nr:MAG: hypothetical protein KVP18_004634 [Porospora cf. gigantea A]
MNSLPPLTYYDYWFCASRMLAKASALLREGMLPIDHQLVKWYGTQNGLAMGHREQQLAMGVIEKMLADRMFLVHTETVAPGAVRRDGTTAPAT